MDWGNFFIQILLEFGGLVGLTVSVVKFFGKNIADKISQKYEFKLNQELETYRNFIENKSYVDKTKYDAELNIIREVSGKMYCCFKYVKKITPSEDGILDDSINVDEVEKSIDDFEKMIGKNMPILSNELYDNLLELLEIFYNQLSAYKNTFSSSDDEISCLSYEELELKQETEYDLFREYYKNLKI